MARANKNKTGVSSGNHLKVTHYDDGTADMEWNWDALLKEVQEATKGVDALVAATESKIKKSRAEKAVDAVVDTVKAVAKKVTKKVKEVLEDSSTKTTTKKPRTKKSK